MESDDNIRLKKQIETIRSNNKKAIMETLTDLRSGGHVSILPELMNLMLISEDEEIRSGITSLLNDLKEQEAAEILANTIADPAFLDIQTILVAACWQNGLDYDKYISTFVDVVILGNYIAAIEAFTVIEEAIGEVGEKQRAKLVTKLKASISDADKEKQALIVELVKVIDTY
jgi:HEAT repeat protein